MVLLGVCSLVFNLSVFILLCIVLLVRSSWFMHVCQQVNIWSCLVCYPRVTPTGLPDVLCFFLVSRADDVRFSCVATWYALELA